MSVPIAFPEQTTSIGRPADMAEDECASLPAWMGSVRLPAWVGGIPTPVGVFPGVHVMHAAMISKWQFSPEEMQELIKNGGSFYLVVYGHAHPVVAITSESPFQPQS